MSHRIELLYVGKFCLVSSFYCLKHKLGLTKSIQVTETLLTCHVSMSGFDIVSKASSSVEVFTQDKNYLVSVKQIRHFMLKTPCDLQGFLPIVCTVPG